MRLQEYIRQNIDPNFEGDELPFGVTVLSMVKNKNLTEDNSALRKIFYLEDGIVQVGINKDGSERIIDVFTTNSFFCANSLLYSKNPGEVEIKTLTSCKLVEINYPELLLAYDNSLVAVKLGRIETERRFLQKSKREKDFLTKSVKERYLNLVKERPDLIALLPDRKIAAYLGIQPESFCRMKKRLNVN